ncbi:MAG TPA: TIGR04283 family arsenosugar biosynthesis glycosyltransferase [Candidatus Binatia bacterium]|jgi:rSAM/selenodomain-associated transferase 2
MRISVIIPVLNEEKTIDGVIAVLRQNMPDELLIVDGGSTDCTWKICTERGVTVLCSSLGRAAQMNFGAKHATGDVLLFLHADTRLPPTAFGDIRKGLEDPCCVGGRFDVKLDSSSRLLKMVGAMISLRSRVTKIATGDQAIFIRRDIFAAIGGYPEIPLMEDIALSRAMKRTGRIACLESCAITSARRWEAEGAWKTILKMWILKTLYLSGVSPLRLKRYYADTR